MTEMSIVIKVTLVLLLSLAATALARRTRASIRHALLAATFAVLWPHLRGVRGFGSGLSCWCTSACRRH